jgi:hypothetical protein
MLKWLTWHVLYTVYNIYFLKLYMVGDLFQNSTENICSTSRVCIHIQEKYSFNFNKFIHIQEKYSYST